MKIINYCDDYQEQVVALVLHIQNTEAKLNLSFAEQPDLADIKSYFGDGLGAFWIALENDKVIGTIGLKRMTATGVVLKKFFVDKAFRGTGVGLQLYGEFYSFCQENEISQIVLDTPSVAVRSHRFYKRAGFCKIKHEELPFPYEYPNRDSVLFLKILQL